MSLYMNRNRACDSRPEGRNRCDHHMLTNCRAPVRDGKPRRCLTSRRLLPPQEARGYGRILRRTTRSSTLWLAPRAWVGVGPRIRKPVNPPTWRPGRGTGTPAESREHGSSASLARAPTACHLTKQRQGRGQQQAGERPRQRCRLTGKLIHRTNLRSVIPQVLPPQSGSFCHRRWSFSTPSGAADTARERHSGSGESDLGDMDSYAKVLDRVPRRLSEG